MLGLVAFGVSSAPAATVYWDINGATAGASAGTTAAGTWNNNNSVWSTSAAGTASTSSWNNGDDAIFSAGTNATGTFTVTVSGTRSVSSISVQEGAITLSGGTLNFNDATPNFTVGSGLTTTVSSVISGSNGLTMDGAGTLSLSGSNSYTGTTTITAGVLQISSNNNLGGTTEALTINGGTLETTASFTLNASRVVTIGSGGGTFDVDSGTTLTYAGIVAGSGTLNKNGDGTFITGGASGNTHSGDVNVNAGVFEIAKTAYVGGINNNAAVAVASGATLRLNGNASYTQETIGSLSGAGTVTNVGAADVNLVYGGNASTTFSGTLTDGTNDLVLIKNGTGTFTLSGNNSYDGATTINAGAINIQSNTALGTATGATTVASGAALEVQGGITVTGEALTLNGSGVSSNGALRNISGTNTWTGAVTLASASEIQSDAGSLTVSGGITSTNLGLTLDGSGNSTLSGIVALGTGTLTKTGTGTSTLSANNTYTGNTSVQQGTLVIAGTTTSPTIDISSGAIADLYVASGSRGNGVATTFTGTGTLLKTGSGTLYWGGTVATFALGSGGLIDVQGGIFDGGNSLGSSAEVWTNNLADLNIAAGANFHGGGTAARVDAITGSGTIDWGWDTNTSFTFGVDNGSGDFSGNIINYGPAGVANNTYYKEGTGTQTFSGSTANTYSYNTHVKDGTLQLNKTAGLNATGTGTLYIGNGTGATDSAQVTLLQNNQINNSSDVQVASDGKFNIGGRTETIDDLGSTGTIKINSGGSLTVDKVGGAISAGEPTGALTGKLDIDGLLTLNGGLIGAADGAGANGTIAHTGASTLEINGDLVFDGTLQLGGGTLKLTDADVSIGTLHITADTVLDFSGVSTLSLDALTFLNSSVILNIINWTYGVDALYTALWPGATHDLYNNGNSSPMNQIIFAGWDKTDTGWDSYDNQIYPKVPEPSTYGLLFVGACSAFFAFRRWRASRPTASKTTR